MRTLGIKPDQVIEQFIVEQIHVGEQQIFMVGRELVLKTAIKTFDMMDTNGFMQPPFS